MPQLMCRHCHSLCHLSELSKNGYCQGCSEWHEDDNCVTDENINNPQKKTATADKYVIDTDSKCGLDREETPNLSSGDVKFQDCVKPVVEEKHE